MNPLLAQLKHSPFPEVAEAIRSEVDQITLSWHHAVRHAMPQMQKLSFNELRESTPQILLAIADALASDGPDVIRELISRAPAMGLSRWRLKFDVVEVMQEERLMRAIMVEHIETAMSRQMDALESAALHAAIDVMLQRSVIALVDQQKSQLRTAAQKELKYLSFLSHDLNNHLYGVTLLLYALGQDLKRAGVFVQAEESVALAQKSIHDTVIGMQRMLNYESLQNSGEGLKCLPVDLHAVATKVADQFVREADAKAVKLAVDVRPGTLVESDEELLSLVLQNLVGNGVKYSNCGTIRIGYDGENKSGRKIIWVSDEGSGIAPDKMRHIFEAFKRGEVHGQRGVGLGLAIASQAAKLLGAELTVNSELGIGSTFRLNLIEDLKSERKSQSEKVVVT